MKTVVTRERLLASTVFASVLCLGGHARAQAAAVSEQPPAAPAGQQEPTATTSAGAPAAPGAVGLRTQDSSGGNTVSEVVVTGSRIARPNFTSPVPVSVIDARAIESTGQINTGDIVRQLPQAGISSLSPTSSNFLTGGTGITTVNLRNLGESRTLVLVNGRRFVPGVVGSQAVDFNDIPTDFIDRIDVVTGGASSVYGSDALAGVVNIITKKNITGLAINAQYGESEHGDDTRAKVNLTAGSAFGGGKGHASVSLTYDSVGAIRARDRGLIDSGNAFLLNGGSFQTSIPGTFSGTPPIGRILIPGPAGASNASRVLNSDGTITPFSTAVNGFNREGIRLLETPYDQRMAAVQLDYQITPMVRFFTELNYVDTEAQAILEPNPLASSAIYGSQPFCTGAGAAEQCFNGIPLTSSTIPDAVKAAVRARNPGAPDSALVVGFQKRAAEIGNRGEQDRRQTFRAVTGFEGDLAPGTHYEISLNYGRTDDNIVDSGNINLITFRQGIEGCAGAPPTQFSNPCVPINVFGANSISAAGANYARAQTGQQQFVEEVVGSAFVRGAAFTLPAGPVGYAVGAEYRTEKSSDVPDALTVAGFTAGNALPVTVGHFDVYELYGEARVPLLANLPLIRSLDANVSGRFSQYSNVGNTTAWAASLEYSPWAFLKLRGQYARAVRAPNIGELYQPAAQNFPSVVDPCQGVTRAAGGQAAFRAVRQDLTNPGNVSGSAIDQSTIGNSVAAACLADPAVAARVARDGSLALTQTETQGVSGFDGGNPNLKPETGDTITFGMLLNYRGNRWLAPLSLSVDYYDIKIKNVIATISEQSDLNGCYAGGTYRPTSLFCSFITRFPAGNPEVGALQFVNQLNANAATLKARGIDVQLSYRLRLDDLFPSGSSFGALTFSATYSYLEKLDLLPFPGGDVLHQAGTVGSSRNTALAGVVYDLGPLEVTVTSRIVGGVTVPTLGNARIGTQAFENLQLRYRINRKATLFLGADNIFNNYVSVGGTNGDSGAADFFGNKYQPTGWNTFPDVYDGIGRRYYAGLRVQF